MTPASVAEVESEFAHELQQLGSPTLPQGVTLGVHCCELTNIADAPAAMPVLLSLPPPAGLRSDSPPRVATGASYLVVLGPPLRVLRRPDLVALLPGVNVIATRAQRALDIAVHRLGEIPNFASWQERGLRVAISLVPVAAPHASSRWNVYFNASNIDSHSGPEDSVAVLVDGDLGEALDAWVGARHEHVSPSSLTDATIGGVPCNRDGYASLTDYSDVHAGLRFSLSVQRNAQGLWQPVTPLRMPMHHASTLLFEPTIDSMLTNVAPQVQRRVMVLATGVERRSIEHDPQRGTWFATYVAHPDRLCDE
jgi:hypothetical protein